MFWKNYELLCINKGESPNAVAKKLNISSGSVTWWKKGKIPHNSTIVKIANYFDVSVGFLLGYETPEVKDRAEKAQEQMNSLRMMRYVPPRTAKKGHIEPKRADLGQKENAPTLSEGEKALIELFRQLPPEKQELVAQTVKAFADSLK